MAGVLQVGQQEGEIYFLCGVFPLETGVCKCVCLCVVSLNSGKWRDDTNLKTSIERKCIPKTFNHGFQSCNLTLFG